VFLHCRKAIMRRRWPIRSSGLPCDKGEGMWFATDAIERPGQYMAILPAYNDYHVAWYTTGSTFHGGRCNYFTAPIRLSAVLRF